MVARRDGTLPASSSAASQSGDGAHSDRVARCPSEESALPPAVARSVPRPQARRSQTRAAAVTRVHVCKRGGDRTAMAVLESTRWREADGLFPESGGHDREPTVMRGARRSRSSCTASPSSGWSELSARCRPRSSGSSDNIANRRWASRRSLSDAASYTADASSGCVNRTNPSRLSTMLAARARSSASGATSIVRRNSTGKRPCAATRRSASEARCIERAEPGSDQPRQTGGHREWQRCVAPGDRLLSARELYCVERIARLTLRGAASASAWGRRYPSDVEGAARSGSRAERTDMKPHRSGRRRVPPPAPYTAW